MQINFSRNSHIHNKCNMCCESYKNIDSKFQIKNKKFMHINQKSKSDAAENRQEMIYLYEQSAVQLQLNVMSFAY